ncbi:MAG: sigma-54-dependent Fis family transcriptional regulator [Methylococcaceae bacterium]|nr:sigma-54-dependent Fis family transcriptional regulator [Methylococcaceae bacterium]
MNSTNSMYLANRNLILFPTDDCTDELRATLESQSWRVHIAHNLRQARDLIAKYPFHVGLSLIGTQNDEKRLAQLKRLFNYSTQIKWIMGIPEDFAHNINNPSSESKLISEYCHDYLTFPVCMDQMLYVLGHTHGMAQLAALENEDKKEALAKTSFLRENSFLQKIYKQIQKVAKEDDAVFIEGDSSEGKKLIADAIHSHSRRSSKPLIAVNCGKLSQDVLHAELFGYEKGAFPGAKERKIGRIESAQGGTLFLDEIGELSKEQQVNLLRFFEERAIIRMGGKEKIAIDVRIIASTYVDLEEAVRAGKFRRDLYYRLRELQLTSFQSPVMA